MIFTNANVVFSLRPGKCHLLKLTDGNLLHLANSTLHLLKKMAELCGLVDGLPFCPYVYGIKVAAIRCCRFFCSPKFILIAPPVHL
jgi:hypothetical protein